MTIVVIGSKAFKAYYNISGTRTVADFDLVASYDDFEKFVKDIPMKRCYPIDSGKKFFVEAKYGTIYEVEIAWEGSTAESLIRLVEDDSHSWWTVPLTDRCTAVCASLDILYMLKMSHRYLRNSPHFHKTMSDIKLMRGLGAKIRAEHEDFYKKRMEATYDYAHPSLMRSKKEFFSGDGIEYKYEHDDIHEAVKLLDKPAYTYFKSAEVMVDMEKFFTLPEYIKLYAVLEESLVLAAERSQLAFPHDSIDPKWSFEHALMKVCTSITSGRFREYAWENYDKVVSLYNIVGYTYMDRVHENIKHGFIREIK